MAIFGFPPIKQQQFWYILNMKYLNLIFIGAVISLTACSSVQTTMEKKPLLTHNIGELCQNQGCVVQYISQNDFFASKNLDMNSSTLIDLTDHNKDLKTGSFIAFDKDGKDITIGYCRKNQTCFIFVLSDYVLH